MGRTIMPPKKEYETDDKETNINPTNKENTTSQKKSIPTYLYIIAGMILLFFVYKILSKK